MTFTSEKRERFFLLNPPFYRRVLRDYYCCTYSKTGYLWRPIDLLVQSGILGADHEVGALDAVATGMSRANVLTAVKDFSPTVIFSLIGSHTFEPDIVLLEDMKRRTGAKIIVSGDSCLAFPAIFLKKHEHIDAILFDFTSKDILRLAEGDVSGVNSSAYKKDGSVVVQRMLEKSEFSYPVPKHNLFASASYNMPLTPTGFASVLASFGCPYSCAFCNSGARSLGFSFRNHDNILEEISSLRARGVSHIFFKDMTFGADRARVERLCRWLADEAKGMTWHAYTRLDLLDAERIEMYAESGCRLIQIGLETTDIEIARRMGKRVDTSRIEEIFRLMKARGVTPGAHFILGLSGERLKSAVKTVRAAIRLDPGYASFNVFSSRPGSELFERGGYGRKTAATTRMAARMAYAAFYLRPRRIASLSRARGRENGRGSLAAAMWYFLFMPDAKNSQKNGRLAASRREIDSENS